MCSRILSRCDRGRHRRRSSPRENVEVVVEAVLDRGADRDLDAGKRSGPPRPARARTSWRNEPQRSGSSSLAQDALERSPVGSGRERSCRPSVDDAACRECRLAALGTIAGRGVGLAGMHHVGESSGEPSGGRPARGRRPAAVGISTRSGWRGRQESARLGARCRARSAPHSGATSGHRPQNA